MDMNQVLAAELNVKPWQVEAAVKLIDEGNTIPFISRYRKEATGSLNDEILRNLYDRLMYLRSLNDRNAGRVRRSQKKKDWSRWRISFFCR